MHPVHGGAPPGQEGRGQEGGRPAPFLARRLELARWFFTLDRPQSAWDEPAIYELHEALAENLELKDRQSAVEYKLEAVEESLDTVTDLWHGRRSLALEWAVVVLIVLEIASAFWAGH